MSDDRETTPKTTKPRGEFCWALDGLTEHPATAMLPLPEIALEKSRKGDAAEAEIEWTNSGFRVWRKLSDIRWEGQGGKRRESGRTSRRTATPSQKKKAAASPAKKEAATPSPRKRKAKTPVKQRVAKSPSRSPSRRSKVKVHTPSSDTVLTVVEEDDEEPSAKRLKGVDGKKRPPPEITVIQRVKTVIVSVKDTIVDTATGLVNDVKEFYARTWG